MMHVLFIGNFFPEGVLKNLLADSRGRIVFSNHIFEMNVLKGLSGREDVDVTALTVPNVGSFPRKNRRFFTGKECCYFEGVRIESAGFCNLWPFFIRSRRRSLFRMLVRILRGYGAEPVKILLSAPEYYAQRALLQSLRKVNVNSSVTVLLPDIPLIMDENSSARGPRKWAKHQFTRLSMDYLQTWDSYILLTETMRDFLPEGCRTMVLEGLVDPASAPLDVPQNDSSIIAYTGVVDRRYGVGLLLDAFLLCGVPDAELWIAGSGPMADELERKANEHPSVRYFGLVSPEEAASIRSKARVLVNPRTSEGRYTRYSFPSKTMEYLLSGKVIVAFMLPGMPEEYRSLLMIPEREDATALAATLREALLLSPEEALTRGERGRAFVLNHKDVRRQGERILAFL